MVILKSLLISGYGASKLITGSPLQNHRSNKSVWVAVRLMGTQTQGMSRQALTKSLELVTSDKVKVSRANGKLVIQRDKPRPLVVMLSWLLAKQNHINKYCDFYLRRGCDVLTVGTSPWQLLWPVKGTQVVAEETLQFLHHNNQCQPLFLHGFSIGGYMWGEICVKMKQDMDRYQHILDRIVGQAWDSAADVTEIQIGLPMAVFPTNPILRGALTKYLKYHLKRFDEEATCHYVRSSQMFHTNLVHSPALFLISKNDPVGSVTSNMRVRESWESMGIKVSWKCWEDSKHVSHFLKYRDEYVKTLENFIDSLDTTGKRKEQSKEGFWKENLREKLQAKL